MTARMNVEPGSNDTGSLNGFTEQFDLNEAHVAYSGLLRRKVVLVNQDNRLCERFGFKHVNGCLCKRHVSSVNSTPVVKNESNCSSASSVGPENDTTKQAAEKPTADDVRQSDLQGAIPKARPREFEAAMNAQNASRNLIPEPEDVNRTERDTGAELDSNDLDLLDRQQRKLLESLTQTTKVQLNLLKQHLKSVGLDYSELSPLDVLPDRFESVCKGEASLEDVQKEAMEAFMKTMNPFQKASAHLQRKNPPSRMEMSEEYDSAEQLKPKLNKTNTSEGEQKNLSSINVTSAPSGASNSDVENNSANESKDEPMQMDLARWEHSVQKEIENGKYAKGIREEGLDTIICLDTSSSMKGAAWDQAKNFVKNFIEGIQHFNLEDTVFEHVALVTFGSETRVQQHLTCDYYEVLRKLDQLQPSGPSPLHAGLMMCRAAVLGAGKSYFRCKGYKILPRIYLITDGRATDSSCITGPDVYTKLDDAQELLIKSETAVIRALHVKVNVVPVGDVELPILATIADISNGKLVDPNDWELQSRAFRNYLAIVQLDRHVYESNSDNAVPLLQMILPNSSPEDMDQAVDFLNTGSSYDEDDEQDELPPLGSRVRRSIPGGDKYQLGTITKHIDEGSVGIVWDEGSKSWEEFKYSNFERNNITITKEPRVLKDQLIDVGCRVKRGADWRYPDQDGGAGKMGNVFRVSPDGIVLVRWDCGGKNSYRYGAEGAFDVDIVNDEKNPSGEVKKNVAESLSEEELERKRILEMNKRNMVAGNNESKRSEAVGVPEPTTATPKAAKNKNLMGDIGERTVSNATQMSAAASATSPLSAESERKLESDQAKNLTQNDRNEASSKGAMSDLNSNVAPYQWAWQDGVHWRPYPEDINQKIESNYIKHPTGTCVISLQDRQYRIVFTQMKQVNIMTREKVAIKRTEHG